MRKLLAVAVVFGLAACAPQVASLEAQPKNVALTKKGEVAKVQVTAKDAQGKVLENVKLTYTSSAPDVATVDAQSGAITAVATGDATVKVASGDKSVDVPVRVSLPATVTVNPATVKLAVGQKASVSARVLDEKGRDVGAVGIAWQSDNQGVVKVERGALTAVAPGTAKVSALVGTVKGEATVTVTPAVAAIEVKPLRLKAGAEARVEPVAKDDQGNVIADATFRFTVEDAAVAAVEATTGAVKALAKGKTKVTVTAGDKSATAEVVVK